MNKAKGGAYKFHKKQHSTCMHRRLHICFHTEKKWIRVLA